MAEPFDFGNLPRFGRMDEYFGLWAMEATRFRLGFERLRSVDLAAHIALGNATPGKIERKLLVTTVGPAEIAGGGEAATPRQTGGDGYAEVPVKGGDSAGNGGGVQIAVIPLSGVLMKQLSSMDSGTSSIAARMDIRHAARNPAIGAILILADSPGGTVSGTSDLADEIAAAAAAKPCYALVEDLCASACYWAVSGCSRIFAGNGVALIGSIGTYMAVADESVAAAMQGVKVKVYATGELKGAGTPGTPITPAMDAYFQSIVDETQRHFAQAVAKNRGLAMSAVQALATGAVWHAGEAQSLGLIDGIKTMDQVLAMLGAAAMKQVSAGGTGGKINGQRAEAAPAIQAEAESPTQNDSGPAAAGALPAGAGSTHKEDAMSDPNTLPPAPAARRAASLQELKAALPKSSAEFREQCLEKGHTVAEAQAAYIQEQDARIEDLAAKAKPTGVTAIRETIAGGAAQAVLLTAKAAKARLSSAAATLAQQTGKPRHVAFQEACRNDPQAHKALVVEHNLAYGRKKQAAQFAEDFEQTQE